MGGAGNTERPLWGIKQWFGDDWVFLRAVGKVKAKAGRGGGMAQHPLFRSQAQSVLEGRQLYFSLALKVAKLGIRTPKYWYFVIFLNLNIGLVLGFGK